MRLPRDIGAVVFDMDGLLIDSESVICEAYLAASRELGRPLSEAQFNDLVGLDSKTNEGQLAAFFGPDFPLEPFYAAARAHAAAKLPAPLKPGVGDLLDLLDARALPRALATSSSRDWVAQHFTAHGLSERFGAIVARGDYARAKPDPEPYLMAAAALDVPPAHCLALEDSYNGVRAAHAAGMMTVMVPDRLAPTDEMRAKTIAVHASLHDVRAVFARSSK